MKEKIMRKIALLAGAVVVLLLCSNLGTASLDDEAYLEQLIAQYREAVELDPFPNAYENGTIRIESIMEDRQHISKHTGWKMDNRESFWMACTMSTVNDMVILPQTTFWR